MDYEKLGVFYMGKEYDIESQSVLPNKILYESKDLTTHAICVGMTGSGKTGLCLSLLEEAAIDGIPVIAIDPKGDLSNLLLTFPQLRAEDFRPWIDEDEALRSASTPEEYAKKVASTWKEGLAKWEQDGERIKRFKDAVDINIYTPGSTAGIPITVLRSFTAPSEKLMNDSDAFRERVTAAVSGILTLLGIDADPIRSKEHILLSNIVANAWKQGQDLNIPTLIRLIQAPGFDKIGYMELDSIFPANERMGLAMQLNNLLASPTFAAWMDGEALQIDQLLSSPEGKPRISIMSIAHLNDSERMFFVTILLNEVLSWVRSQSGTSSLRAILYMDEVFGYFPPTANPPTKQPMLTLLKQARAFGLGVVLATQNPVDLDYKGLSNTGTWFLGRLQTERDKQRLLDGLENANATAGHGFNRSRIEKIMSSLGKRVFLLHNVHEDEPVVFQTRWALSYLRGPLTRQQIMKLMSEKKARIAEDKTDLSSEYAGSQMENLQVPVPGVKNSAGGEEQSHAPIIPPEISQRIMALQKPLPAQSKLIYRPGVVARGKLHYTDTKAKLSCWKDFRKIVAAGDGLPDEVWEESDEIPAADLDFVDEYEANCLFDDVDSKLLKKATFTALERDLKSYLYREENLVLSYHEELGVYSSPDETEAAFKGRLQHGLREERDLEMEKMKSKYAPKISVIKERIKRAEDKVETEQDQASYQTMNSTFSIGTSILGALFGRKLTSRTNMTSVASAARNATRISKERGDISRAKNAVKELEDELKDLEHELEVQLEQFEGLPAPSEIEVSEYAVRPRKADITVEEVSLVWLPYSLKANGISEPLYLV